MTKKKKCYVLIVSRYFPKLHPKNGAETNFFEKINKEKKHTIRSNYELWAKRANEVSKGNAYISIRQWSGKPYRSPQQELMQIHNIGVESIGMTMYPWGEIYYSINNMAPGVSLKTIANNDGLEKLDFINWFFKRTRDEAQTFEGVIIHFTDFRYITKDRYRKC